MVNLKTKFSLIHSLFIIPSNLYILVNTFIYREKHEYKRFLIRHKLVFIYNSRSMSIAILCTIRPLSMFPHISEAKIKKN